MIDWSKIRVLNNFEEIREYLKFRTRTIKVADIVGIDLAEVEYEDKIYPIAYTPEKAKELGIKYTHWGNADFINLETPCYVQFADRWIGLVLEVVASLGSIVLLTPIGQRAVIAAAGHRNQKRLTPYFDLSNKPIAFYKYRGNNDITKSYVVARLMAAGCSVDEISAFFKRDRSLDNRKKIKQMMSQRSVKEMASKMVKEALDERGIDPSFVIDWALEAQNLIKTTKNAKAYVELIKEVANWTGFNDKETETTTQSVELIDYHKDLKSLEEKKQSAKLTQTVEKEIE